MAAPSLVVGQLWQQDVAGSNTGTVNLTSPAPTPGAGVIILCAGIYSAAGSVNAVTYVGGSGVTVTPILEHWRWPGSGSIGLGAWRITYTSPPSSLTIDCASTSYFGIGATEITGDIGVDVVSTAVNIGSTPNPGNITATNLPNTTVDETLVFGLLTWSDGFDAWNNASQAATGYLELFDAGGDNTTYQALATVYKTAATAGSHDPIFVTTGATEYILSAFALAPSTPAGSPGSPVTNPPVITNLSSSSYYDGETGIVITGTDFTGTQGTVTINGVAQTITNWTDTSITFTAVLGGNSLSTPYNLIVTNTSASPDLASDPEVVQYQAVPLYLTVRIDPSAASATVDGVVFQAPTSPNIVGTYIGEFTGATFSAQLDNGQAILQVALADFGGGSLTAQDTPVVLVRNATYTTGIVDATVEAQV